MACSNMHPLHVYTCASIADEARAPEPPHTRSPHRPPCNSVHGGTTTDVVVAWCVCAPQACVPRAHVHVELRHVHCGKKGRDPVEGLRFYQKDNDVQALAMRLDECEDANPIDQPAAFELKEWRAFYKGPLGADDEERAASAAKGWGRAGRAGGGGGGGEEEGAEDDEEEAMMEAPGSQRGA